jgi:hypothetical protein
MTGDQSRFLKVGDRVFWGAATTDLGTVIGTSWSEVTISWDDTEKQVQSRITTWRGLSGCRIKWCEGVGVRLRQDLPQRESARRWRSLRRPR